MHGGVFILGENDSVRLIQQQAKRPTIANMHLYSIKGFVVNTFLFGITYIGFTIQANERTERKPV
jgi:hypothetical protein